ncbi:unnamed protein product [Blepharisma stoltei]|uniref:Uncharacterized protein n=1 Tax=Blepharisma stoltei TaxID=1481888 RepID=A0AAU9I8D0_9CILI|nr:unnamed protein product [Blepharisma stoltei]
MSHGRSKSKQARPIKDPTEVLNSINDRINARKRILETLQEQTSDFKDEVVMQLKSRDDIISELNKEIETLKLQLKSKPLENVSPNHSPNKKQIIIDLQSENSLLEEKLLDFQEKYFKESQNWAHEKEQLEILNEAISEEIEHLKNQIKQKTKDSEDARDDVKQLSEVIEKMSEINKDLTGKIEKLNNDFSDLTIKSYELQVKAANVEELENSLQEYMINYQKSQESFSNLSGALQSYTQETCDFLRIALERINSAINEFNKGKIEIGANMITHIKTDIINRIETRPEKNYFTKNSDEIINGLKDQIKKLELRVQELEKISNPLINQVKGQKELIELLKRQELEAAEIGQKKIEAIYQHNEYLKSQLQALRSDLNQLDNVANNVQAKLMSSEAKTKKINDKLAAEHIIKNQLEKSFAELNEKYKNLKQKFFDLENNIKNEKDLCKKYANTIQVLRDEISKKDTNAIKYKKLALQYQTQAEKLQVKVSEFESEQNKNFTKQMEKNIKELQEKEQQIEILKNVVKGSQLQVKQREIDISRIKSRIERHSPELRSIADSPPPQDQSFRLSAEKTSQACQIIQRFFKMASFIKSKPASARNEDPKKPSELKRMVNKLKQELNGFPTFNTRELTSSVVEIQPYVDSSKVCISLEEVLTAIVAVLDKKN